MTSTAKSPGFNDPIIAASQAKSRRRTRADKRESAQALQSDTIVPRNDLLPELKYVQKRPSELKPRTKNLRKLDEADVLEAINVIRTSGMIEAIMISQDGATVINGELRLEAAKRLGLPLVPCYYVVGLSPAEERAAAIQLNRLGQRREWKLDDLKVELDDLQHAGIRIDALGFDDIELDSILVVQDGAGAVDVVDEDGPAVTQPGDLWQLGDHRLLCGDALAPASYDQLLGDEQVQSLVTDPPYNIKVSTIVSTKHREFANASGEMTADEFAAFLASFLDQAKTRLVAGGTAYMFIDWRQLELMLRVVREADLELLNLAVWVKATAGMGSFMRSQHELVIVAKRPGQHKNRIQLGKRGRDRSNVWFAAGAGTLGSDARAMLSQHPTSKPVRLLTDTMIDVTDRGDIVLDCFGGSGSTLMAAQDTGRHARLIELDPRFCDVIVRRWQTKTGEQATLVGTGKTYAEVLAERSTSDPAPLFDPADTLRVPASRRKPS